MVDRTPKRVAKAAETDPQYNDYFTAMKTGSSEVQPQSGGDNGMAEQLSELMKRVDALTAQNEVLRMQPQQPQVQYVQVPQQEQPEETLPDPILDSAGFANFLLQRADALNNARFEAWRQEQADQTNSADAHDKLWSGFLAVDGNEGWEDQPEKVQVAALKVGKRLASRGIDLNAYMFQYTDKFYADVAKQLKADFGEPSPGADAVDESDVDRTAGLAGGQAAPVTKPAGDNKSMPDLTGDLVAIQRKGGWY